jgi:hypothetical protein
MCILQKQKNRNPLRLRFNLVYGAEGETRTPTEIHPPDPEPGASTNSATSAQKLFALK